MLQHFQWSLFGSAKSADKVTVRGYIFVRGGVGVEINYSNSRGLKLSSSALLQYKLHYLADLLNHAKDYLVVILGSTLIWQEHFENNHAAF